MTSRAVNGILYKKRKANSMIEKINAIFLWHAKKPWILRIFLLLVPVVNWVLEFCMRWTIVHSQKKMNGGDMSGIRRKIVYIFSLVMGILATLPTAIVLGWIDAVWLLLFRHILALRYR